MFVQQHNASAFFMYQGAELSGIPVDVSKGHLSVSFSGSIKDSLPKVGDVIPEFSLNVLGKNYWPLKLVVSKEEEAKDGRLKLVFKSEDDAETSAHLWRISYLLRTDATGHDDEFGGEGVPVIPARGLYTEEARKERLAFVREKTGAALERVSQTTLDPKALVSNIEAFIGSVEVPVGIGGPLLIKGANAHGLYYAPLATSEGALVASVTRGATAITRSGGATARVLGQRMMRVPVFVLSDLASAFFFAEWVKDHFKEIAAETRKYSNYADLAELETNIIGKSVNVQFIYQTGDAAGQNMTTTCTWQACQWIMKQMAAFEGIKFDRFFIESNLSNDKKVTYQSFIKGRGIRVIAECVISPEVCRQVLKVSPETITRGFMNGVSGSIAAGMVGMNINIANVIAAIFTATGQDIACVHESAIGHLHVELTDDGSLYAAMTLPSLVIGTIGGGTNLPHQKECLQILDCAGAGKAHKLAEIIASYCLALDLSTMSAIATDQFARAHEALGRNRPVEWLKLGDFNTAFFNRVMQSFTGNAACHVAHVDQIKIKDTGSSIITELTAHKLNKLIGHFPYRIKLAGDDHPINVMIKVKPLADEVILVSNRIASLCDARLAQTYNKFKDELDFQHCHVRELEVMKQDDSRFRKHAPTVYYAWSEPKREAFVLVEELLENMELMDTADDTSSWTPLYIDAALTGIAEVHSIWYGREQELRQKPWLSNAPTQQSMMKKLRLWEMLGVHASEEFPEWFTPKDMEAFRSVIYTLPEWYAEIDRMPKTLIHNDFNPRNICFRKTDGGPVLCAYDWELATIHLPQHDLAELLTMTLQPSVTPEEIDHYVEVHRLALEKAIGSALDPVIWRRGYELCLWDLLANRIPMYVMGHTFRHYGFMERVQATFRRLLSIEKSRRQK